MGVGRSKLSKDQLEEYSALTYFGEGEIVNLLKKFESLDRQATKKDLQFAARISEEKLRELPELKHNPFLERLCHVFSTSQNIEDRSLCFDDFVDMMNVLSEYAPFQLKAHYAFRVFDFNDDDYIDEEDMFQVLRCLSNNDEHALSDTDFKDLVDAVMREADLDKDNQLGRSEFEHVLSKCPDFMGSFKVRVL